MSEPLAAEERGPVMPGADGSCDCDFCAREARYEATVRREEERALAAEARVRALEEALSEALRAGAA